VPLQELDTGLALKLSERFDHLYITSRRISELEKLNDEIIKNNCECTIVPLDLKKIDLLDELASQIYSKERKARSTFVRCRY
jgi:short-subunit dehydrogenase